MIYVIKTQNFTMEVKKITLYKVLVSPVVLYVWVTTKSDELKLSIFEWKILRRIYEHKINNELKYEIRTNQCSKTCKATISCVLNSRRLSWAGPV